MVKVSESDKMAAVNGTYTMGGYEKNWSKILHVISNVKVFAKHDGLPSGRKNTIHCIHPCVTHTD